MLDTRQCSAKTAARMLRDLLAKDASLPPALAANVLTAADLLDALPEPALQSAPPGTKKRKRAGDQSEFRKPALVPGCSQAEITSASSCLCRAVVIGHCPAPLLLSAQHDVLKLKLRATAVRGGLVKHACLKPCVPPQLQSSLMCNCDCCRPCDRQLRRGWHGPITKSLRVQSATRLLSKNTTTRGRGAVTPSSSRPASSHRVQRSLLGQSPSLLERQQRQLRDQARRRRRNENSSTQPRQPRWSAAPTKPASCERQAQRLLMPRMASSTSSSAKRRSERH